MTTWCLEIRSTQQWDDVRYRAYTRSDARKEAFVRRVRRIDFTDSGHGLVPHAEAWPPRKRRLPEIRTLSRHVRECIT